MGHAYNIKNSLEFKLLAFWRKYTPFIDQKCTYKKVTKQFVHVPPPPDLDKIQKNSSFFRDIVPKFERIDEFKSIIRHYGLEHRWRAISKQETRRWCDITTRLVPLNVQRATLAPYVRTYVRRGFFLRQAPRGENGDQAAWENTVQILGEK